MTTASFNLSALSDYGIEASDIFNKCCEQTDSHIKDALDETDRVTLTEMTKRNNHDYRKNQLRHAF